jgi:hypothetical protein
MTASLPDADPAYPIDAGVARYVSVLRAAGVETFESCEGGPGHCAPEPFVRFDGERSAGWRALCAAQEYALPVLALAREWPIVDGEPTGPWWKLTFRTKDQSGTS